MKKYEENILLACLVFILVGCGNNEKSSIDTQSTMALFQETITEISNGTMFVKPVERSLKLKSSDCFSMSTQNMSASPNLKVGDVVKITYNGYIEEIYPSTLGKIYSITVIEKSE